MKLISKTLIILFTTLFVLTFSSCKKVYIYDESKADDFINEYYEYLADNKQGFVAIDLRNLNPDYSDGHLKGFKSYQYYIARNEKEPDSVYESRISETFCKWIQQNYSKDLAVFLIDYNGTVVEQAAVKLKGLGYKNVYIYTGGYDTIVNHLNDLVEVVTGVEDCGC